MEREALFASGIGEKRQIAQYGEKLGYLCQEFTRDTIPTSHPLLKAKLLFNWLWEKKPARYKSHGSFKLNNVIDSQLSEENQTVGNCLGLTLLYNCLLRRMSIRAEASYLEEAFERSPHVFTTLQMNASIIDIENILPEGFDYKGHLNHPFRTRWGDKELVGGCGVRLKY